VAVRREFPAECDVETPVSVGDRSVWAGAERATLALLP
jgi:hypothetical protein